MFPDTLTIDTSFNETVQLINIVQWVKAVYILLLHMGYTTVTSRRQRDEALF